MNESKLPKGWEVKRLGDVCDFVRGPFGGSLKKSCFKENGFAVYEQQHAIYNQFSQIRYFIDNNKFYEMKRFELFKGDLIMSCSGTMGKVAIVPDNIKQGIINQALLKLTPSNLLNVEYLKSWMDSVGFQESLAQYTIGAAIKNVASVKVLKQIQIPIPPLFEQKRIVSTLDKVFAEIEKAKSNAQQNLKNAKDLFESYLQEVFENRGDGWEEKTLEQISDFFGRGKSKHRPRNDKKLYGGDYPFIQTGDIRNCEHYITDYSQTYNDVGLKQSKLWPEGTICITIAANIAETGVLTFEACFPDSVIGVVVNKKIVDIDYVEYLLQSFKTHLQTLGKGSAQDNINLGTFKDKLFPFPSMDQQQDIVRNLDALSAKTRKLENIYQKKITDLEKLKKSILQKAFRGGL
ncbi:MAG: restriction endonuclease subunit S [Bacteroidetes bacterium]|nr:restriction endonuclease subunit S [Bacteroidota bacterium]